MFNKEKYEMLKMGIYRFLVAASMPMMMCSTAFAADGSASNPFLPVLEFADQIYGWFVPVVVVVGVCVAAVGAFRWGTATDPTESRQGAKLAKKALIATLIIIALPTAAHIIVENFQNTTLDDKTLQDVGNLVNGGSGTLSK